MIDSLCSGYVKGPGYSGYDVFLLSRVTHLLLARARPRRQGHDHVAGFNVAAMRPLLRSRWLGVATHNIMNGVNLGPLLAAYRRLQRDRGLHVLCIQEHVAGAAAAIARSLGGRYAVARHDATPRLVILYDRTVLSLRRARCARLPLLDRVPLWQRLYAGGLPEQKTGLIVSFRAARGKLTVANFHLDAAGYNEHRGAQLSALSRAIAADSARSSFQYCPPLVACGDTNAFTWQKRHAEPELARMLEPLRRQHGARDAHADHPRDNHFFARAHEPKIGQRIAVAVGRVGVDFPRRYDVICSSLPIVACGMVTTPASDHDLVWAHVGRSPARAGGAPRRAWRHQGGVG